jgi:hypothetical protein
MVGLLNAPRGTKLYQRLKEEGRLLTNFDGNNTDVHTNIVPKMNRETLVDGYKYILDTIYSPREYFERVRTFLEEYRTPRIKDRIHHLQRYHLEGFIKSIWFLGIRGEKGKRYYWKLMIATLFKHLQAFPLSVSLSISGFHFRKVAEELSDTRIKSGPNCQFR